MEQDQDTAAIQMPTLLPAAIHGVRSVPSLIAGIRMHHVSVPRHSTVVTQSGGQPTIHGPYVASVPGAVTA